MRRGELDVDGVVYFVGLRGAHLANLEFLYPKSLLRGCQQHPVVDFLNLANQIVHQLAAAVVTHLLLH